MIADRFPADFPLFLSDKEAGGSGTHETLHNFIWSFMLLPAQKRLNDPQLAKYVSDLVAALKKLPEMPTASTAKPLVQRMVIRYMCWALFEIEVTEAQVGTMQTLFYGGGLTTDYTTTRLKPLALPRVFLGAERRAVAEVEAEISPCTSSQRFPLAKGST